MSSDQGNHSVPGDSDGDRHRSTRNSNRDNIQPRIETTYDARVVRRTGRGIRRVVMLCGTITQLVTERDRRLLAANNDGANGDTPPHEMEVQRRRDRDYQSYLELTKLIPAFKDVIANPNDESRAFYYAQLHDGANNARSDDISRMKWAVANFLNKRLNGPPDPPLDINTRDGRGLQNNFTGRLLCPIKYDWEDPVVWAKIRDGVDGYSASDNYWIRCLYEGENGNPEDVETGFLKSTLLVKCFQTIFTAPSSAKGNIDALLAAEVPADSQPRRKRGRPLSKRPAVAIKLNMDGKVTARAIAYAAVQLHFSLTDATHWMSDYNGFSYEEFYEFIIDFLEADQTLEGKAATAELYNWWNSQVFPGAAATRGISSTSVRQSSLAIIREQRRARLSRIPA